jgi:hypothetical protein
MRQGKTLLVPLALFACLVACATTEHAFRGESGPITWEIVDARQRMEESGSRMRWDYTILLRNHGQTAIIFERMDLALQPAETASNVWGGIDSRSFTRHIDPNGELRVPRSDSWSCPRCGASELPRFFAAGIIRWITFTGQDMQSMPIKVEVRIRLNSSVGARQ